MGYPIIWSLNFVALSTVEAGTELYTAELSKAGRELDDIDLPLAVKVYVAPTDEEAERDARPNAQWFFNALSQFLPGAEGRQRPEGYEEYPEEPEKVAGLASDNPWEWGTAYGFPQKIIQDMRAYSERAFINHWMVWMRIGELEHRKVMRSMELFAKEDMPGLKAEVPVPS